jgi:septum site-determining protein MinD
MFEEVKNEFDFCLVDSPAGIGQGFKMAHTAADMSSIVTVGEIPSIKDAQQAAMIVRDDGTRDVCLLVNRVKYDDYRQLRTTIDDVIDIVGAQLIGIVREDRSVMLSLHENTPLILYKKRRAAYDFLDIARRIRGEDIPIRQARRSLVS